MSTITRAIHEKSEQAPVTPVMPDAEKAYTAHTYRASMAVWDWRRTRAKEAQRQRTRHARRGGVIQFAVAAVATSIFYWIDFRVVAIVAASLGTLSLVAALASPTGLYASMQKAIALLGVCLGTISTWVLLVPMYYLVFCPFGLLFRRRAKSPVSLGFDRGTATYWKKREGKPEQDSYHRGF